MQWDARARKARARKARAREVLARHANHVARAFLFLLAALPQAARGDWLLGADASLRHDDNVGNAQYRADIVEDSVIGARLSVYQALPLGESYSLTVGGDLGGESFHRFTGLDNASLGATIALRKKWGLGAFAPWARASLSLARLDYDYSYRNAWNYRATLASGRRIDDRWNLWADYAYERRAAHAGAQEVPGLSGDAYSQNSHNLGAHLQYAWNERASVVLGLLARHGDVVSTTAGSARIFYASRALAEDPAFGPEDYAYRIRATTYGVSIGLGFSPTAHSALGCAFARFETHADGGNNYTKSIPQITWDYRF